MSRIVSTRMKRGARKTSARPSIDHVAGVALRCGCQFRQFNRNDLRVRKVGEATGRITFMTSLYRLVIVAAVLVPVAAYGQSGGGGGGAGSGGGGSAGGGSAGGASGGSATGAASGPTAGSPTAAGSPSAGSTGAGSASISGVPNAPRNPGSLNNSVNDPSGAGNASKLPSATAPGTNSLGTANSTGSSSGAAGSGSSEPQTTGSALNRPGGQSGGRIDGTTRRSDTPGDEEIRAEDRTVEKKIKSICKGC